MGFPSEKQANTIDGIINCLLNGQDCCLVGPAGSGKSSVVGEIMSQLDGQVSIRLTALTNKASKSLEIAIKEGRERKGEADGAPSADTIHKFLCLKPVRKGLVQRKGEDFPYQSFKGIVVIDESSMLGSEGKGALWYWIQFAKKQNPNLIILYVGDSYQLPPIGEEIAICFTPEANLQIFELTEIFRQADGNPIVSIANRYRLAQNGEGLPPLIEEYNDKGEGVFLISRAEFEKAALSAGEHAKEGRVRFLAYTNRAAIYYDKMIRNEMFDRNANHIEIGEKLVANEPYINPETEEVLIGNCEEMTVTSVDPGRDYFEIEHSHIEVMTESGNAVSVNVAVDELKRKDFINNVWQELNDSKNVRNPSKFEQKHFEELKQARAIIGGSFADLRYNYSSTIHKCQGQSIDIVFIDLDNIRRIRDDLEMLKSVYVAMTRAKKRIYVTGDLPRRLYTYK